MQRQIDRQVEKFLEILAGKDESPSKEDGSADAEVLSDEVIQGNTSHCQVVAVIGRPDLGRTTEPEDRCVLGPQHLHLEHSDLAEVGLCRRYGLRGAEESKTGY
jgi:hypothetical protein